MPDHRLPRQTSDSRFFVKGAWAIAPLVPGIIPFGMIAGVAARDAGLGPGVGIGQSIIVFAGAAQLAVLQLLDEGALPVVAILTALIINLRFAMYSASLAPHLVGLRWPPRLAVAYLMTDQVYAMSAVRFGRDAGLALGHRFRYYLGAGVTNWVTWQSSTAAGYVLGGRVPAGSSLDFFLPLSFLALLVPGLRDRPAVVAAVVGGFVALVAHGLPFNLGLFTAAVCGMAAGYVTETRLTARRQETTT